MTSYHHSTVRQQVNMYEMYAAMAMYQQQCRHTGPPTSPRDSEEALERDLVKKECLTNNALIPRTTPIGIIPTRYEMHW